MPSRLDVPPEFLDGMTQLMGATERHASAAEDKATEAAGHALAAKNASDATSTAINARLDTLYRDIAPILEEWRLAEEIRRKGRAQASAGLIAIVGGVVGSRGVQAVAVALITSAIIYFFGSSGVVPDQIRSAIERELPAQDAPDEPQEAP